MTKNKLKTTAAILAAALVSTQGAVPSSIVSAKTATVQAQAAKSTLSKVTIDKKGSIYVGESLKLNLSSTPKDAKLKWKTSDKSIATVNKNGSVKAKSAGEVTITCTVTKGSESKKLKSKVTVKGAEAVKLNQSDLVLEEGENITLKRYLTPAASDKVKWTSSDESIVKVTKGKITALKQGEATVTAKATSGKTATCKVSVVEDKTVTNITLANVKNGEYKLPEGTYENVKVNASVGEAQIYLDNVKIKGKLYIESGAEYTINAENTEIADVLVVEEGTSIKTLAANGKIPKLVVKGLTTIKNIITNSHISIKKDTSAKIDNVKVSPVKEEPISVSLEGYEGNIDVNSSVNAPITLETQDCKINEVKLTNTVKNQTVELVDKKAGTEEASTIKTVAVNTSANLTSSVKANEMTISEEAKEAQIKVTQPVEKLKAVAESVKLVVETVINEVLSEGINVNIEISKDAVVTTITTSGDNTQLKSEGKVEEVTVKGNGTNVEAKDTVVNVSENATGVTANGGEVQSGTSSKVDSTGTITDTSDYKEPETPDDSTTGGDTTGGDTTGGDSTGGDTTGGDSTGGDTIGGDTTGGDSTGGDSTGGDTTNPDDDYYYSSDATLSKLTYTIDGAGEEVINLTAETDTYEIELPADTSKTATIKLTGTPAAGADITTNDGVTLTDGAGTATITVTAEDGTTKKYTIKFTTKAAQTPEETPKIEYANTATVKAGAATEVALTLAAGADISKVTVTSSDEAKATAKVENNKIVITGVAAGSATITVKYDNKELTDKITVTVEEKEQGGGTPTETPEITYAKTATVKVGATTEVALTLAAGADISKVTVTSSDEAKAKAKVENNKIVITGVAAGSATITVKYDNKELTDKITVTVEEKEQGGGTPTETPEITYAKTATVKVDGTTEVALQLAAGADISKVTVTSSDETKAKAKVENNKIVITGVAAGSATITVKYDNKELTDKITVTVEGEGGTTPDKPGSQEPSTDITVESLTFKDSSNAVIATVTNNAIITSASYKAIKLNNVKRYVNIASGGSTTASETAITVGDKNTSGDVEIKYNVDGKDESITVKVFEVTGISVTTGQSISYIPAERDDTTSPDGKIVYNITASAISEGAASGGAITASGGNIKVKVEGNNIKTTDIEIFNQSTEGENETLKLEFTIESKTGNLTIPCILNITKSPKASSSQ